MSLRSLFILSFAAISPFAGADNPFQINFDTEREIDVFMDMVGLEDITDQLTFENGKAHEIIELAYSFIGKPYRRGAKGPKAFDCSGFTSYVFKQFDLKLAASSRSQFLQGEAVSNDNIRPGDLLFFSRRKAGKQVGHVGIVVEVDQSGNATFIHAARHGGIRLDSYPDGGYYTSHFIGARRIL